MTHEKSWFQVLPGDPFGYLKWPFQGWKRDLHLGKQKVTDGRSWFVDSIFPDGWIFVRESRSHICDWKIYLYMYHKFKPKVNIPVPWSIWRLQTSKQDIIGQSLLFLRFAYGQTGAGKTHTMHFARTNGCAWSPIKAKALFVYDLSKEARLILWPIPSMYAWYIFLHLVDFYGKCS